MNNSYQNIFDKIQNNYNITVEYFILYNNIITQIKNTHTLFLQKNNFDFHNYSLSLDLLYYNKEIIENELNYFISCKNLALNKLYQDIYEILKKVIKLLYSFNNDQMTEKEFIIKNMHDIKHISVIKSKIDIDLLVRIFNLLKEYLNNYKVNIDTFKNFIDNNCTSKVSFDIKNLITNLNTQYKKFIVEYDGANELIFEILSSHLNISEKFIEKLNVCVKLLEKKDDIINDFINKVDESKKIDESKNIIN
jgi:hypothetical protein